MPDQSIEIGLSTDQNPVDSLTAALSRATHSVDAVVYKFDLPEIYRALEKAIRKRDVKVKLIVDQRQMIKVERARGARKKKLRKSMRWMSCARRLARRGATVKVWTKNKLHAKFVIVDRREVLTGSYNWTKSARSRNTELLLLIADAKSVTALSSRFMELWKAAERFSPDDRDGNGE